MKRENAPVHPLSLALIPLAQLCLQRFTRDAARAQSSNSCSQAVEQLGCARCRDKPDLSHTPLSLPWLLGTEPWPCCPPCVPSTSRGCSRWPGPRRRSRSGSRRSRRICGCWAATWGAGQPLEGPSGPGALQEGREEHQLQPGAALESGSYRGPTERELSLANAASHSSQAGPTRGNHSTGELRRKEQRALRRENHC